MKSTWTPTWISLPAALMWWATRDIGLTEAVERDPNRDSGMEILVTTHLAIAQSAGRAGIADQVVVQDAWPAFQHLIADEKIVAEGRSLERHGLISAIETHHPNQPIPSGDASNLEIMDRVSGIEPKYALGPGEHYRFHNGQGRYWYDVRLRASDVFKEFPVRRQMAEAIGPPIRPAAADFSQEHIWPMATILAWLRAISRVWPADTREAFLRDTFCRDRCAFPAVDPPIEEGRRLIAYAGAHPDRLRLYSPQGAIEVQSLGPDAKVLPTVDASQRHTFGLWPHQHVNVDNRILDICCKASEVQAAWPAERNMATEDGAGKKSTRSDRVDLDHRDPSAIKQVQAKSRRGRKIGSGSFAHADAPLLEKMESLIQEGKAVSPEAAAKIVAPEAHGAGTIDSKVDRLAKRFREK